MGGAQVGSHLQLTVDEGGDTIAFNGVSEYLTVEVQTADNDARWRIELRECAECRAS